jgi:hypothetical protein
MRRRKIDRIGSAPKGYKPLSPAEPLRLPTDQPGQSLTSAESAPLQESSTPPVGGETLPRQPSWTSSPLADAGEMRNDPCRRAGTAAAVVPRSAVAAGQAGGRCLAPSGLLCSVEYFVRNLPQ